MKYPFTPKSNKKLQVGDYWLIELSNKSYCVGIVIDVPPIDLRLSREIVVGILKWNKKYVPEISDLENSEILEQGHAHIKTISYSGEQIVGNIDLIQYNIIPLTMIDSYGANGKGFHLMKGYKKVGKFEKYHRHKYQMAGYWGYDYIKEIAEQVFVEKNEDWLDKEFNIL